MPRLILACSLAASTALLAQGPTPLTAAEQAAGWRMLFDGATLAGWRAYASETPPPGWKADNGELVRRASGGDLMTVEQFADFELTLEWKISTNGNSGVMFRVGTGGVEPWHSGPEFQILHNAGHKDGTNALTAAGANYAVNAPARDLTRPVGEWNTIRLIARGPHVEHWMNLVKLLEYEIGSPDWEARVKASKFGVIPSYGRLPRGHIVLQDHGDLVTYRNIRIRPL